MHLMSEMYILYSFKYSWFKVFLSFLNEIPMIFHTYEMLYIFYTKKFFIIIQSVKMILVHTKCKIFFCNRNISLAFTNYRSSTFCKSNSCRSLPICLSFYPLLDSWHLFCIACSLITLPTFAPVIKEISKELIPKLRQRFYKRYI